MKHFEHFAGRTLRHHWNQLLGVLIISLFISLDAFCRMFLDADAKTLKLHVWGCLFVSGAGELSMSGWHGLLGAPVPKDDWLQPS
jgi:hypothetical protein